MSPSVMRVAQPLLVAGLLLLHLKYTTATPLLYLEATFQDCAKRSGQYHGTRSRQDPRHTSETGPRTHVRDTRCDNSVPKHDGSYVLVLFFKSLLIVGLFWLVRQLICNSVLPF